MSEVLTLPAKLDLAAADQLVTSLKAQEGDISLDAAEVTHMGAICLQALIAASAHARSHGHAFELRNVSDKVAAQLAVMGTSPQELMEGA